MTKCWEPLKNARKSIHEFLIAIWNFRTQLIIEPFFACYMIPSIIQAVAIYNLALEKACRANLGYNETVCTSMLMTSENGINCEEQNATDPMAGFNAIVCTAETETQKLVAGVNGIRGPLAAIFPILVILFFGAWCDKKKIYKPCMFIPMFGEILSSLALLISSTYMGEIPMQFTSIIEKVVPALFGGSTLLVMGCFSYLSISTAEKDRVFRFGIFATVLLLIPLVASPLSGFLYTKLGYVNVFIIGICFFGTGALYMIFFVKEPKAPVEDSVHKTEANVNNGHDNLAFEAEQNATATNKNSTVKKDDQKTIEQLPKWRRNACCRFLTEFFDPSLAYGCIKVLIRPRENGGRKMLILMLFAYALFMGPVQSEADYIYQFSLFELHFSPEEYSYFDTTSTVATSFGTFLMTSVFSKIYHMSDSMVGFIATLFSIISRPIYAFSRTALPFYLACIVDLFLSTKSIAVKAIATSFVEVEELGRLFSILGISDSLGTVIFPPIYSALYTRTVEHFPGAFFLFSDIFFTPSLIIFGISYFIMKKRAQRESAELNDIIETIDEEKVAEITHM